MNTAVGSTRTTVHSECFTWFSHSSPWSLSCAGAAPTERGSLRSIYLCARAARFSGGFAVLPPPACPAHVANVAKQLGVPITETRRAVRTGRVLACLAGTSSIQVIARQQLGVVTFIVFSVSSKMKAQLEDSALHSAEKSVVQPVLPRSITSSIRMARRKTWPEGVAERRGRKAWLKSVVGRRGRKAWPKGVVGRRACRNRRTFSNGSPLMVNCFGQLGVVDPVRKLLKQLTPRGLQPGPLARHWC